MFGFSQPFPSICVDVAREGFPTVARYVGFTNLFDQQSLTECEVAFVSNYARNRTGLFILTPLSLISISRYVHRIHRSMKTTVRASSD